MGPLQGLSVVDLSRYLPGPFASRELMDLGARVVRLLPPSGDPMEGLAPAWHEALNRGKETVLLDLKEEPEAGRALCAQADVVLESFRPGVVDRLGVGPGDLPDSVVYCSFTGFGLGGPHERRAGHDLNYQGWAGLLADTAPAMPPTQLADLAGGALTAVTRILAALLERTRTGRGAHIVVSLTHGAHRLVSHRVGGEPIPRLLTGGLACYRIYPTADGRHLTVAALEPVFFARLCELLDVGDLVDRQFDPDAQEALAARLAERIASRPLAAWLELFDGEDVSVGPVASLEEAAAGLR
ncbi:MAG TPA: CaiB/BaiF CoA-transferase family protein [Gaiellaceae bacterium]|nr:CaiB/BaiF CoA-transferase family protein [Gaiellaceae bacterium]